MYLIILYENENNTKITNMQASPCCSINVEGSKNLAPKFQVQKILPIIWETWS
jgi:hypothetical protein